MGGEATPPHKNFLCVFSPLPQHLTVTYRQPSSLWCSSRPWCALRIAPHAGTSLPPPRSRPWPPSRASAPSRPLPPTRRLVGKRAPGPHPYQLALTVNCAPPQQMRTAARSFHIPRTGSNTFKGSLLNCCAGGCCACCCKMLCACTLPRACTHARARSRA